MNEILLVLLLLQKGLLSLLCQRLNDLLVDETLPVCDVHNHADHRNTQNKNTLRLVWWDEDRIVMSVMICFETLRVRPLTSNIMGMIELARAGILPYAPFSVAVSSIRFHRFPAGLQRGTMTKNTKTKTVCKAGTQEEKRSIVSFKTKKPGQAKKVAANSP